MRHTARHSLALMATLLLLAGCASQHPQRTNFRDPAVVRDEISRLMPAATSDRAGWARDIEAAFSAQGILPSTQNICAVLAVTAQESTFQVAPPVPGLAGIARREVDRRAADRHIPRFVVSTALKVKSPDGRSYAERLQHVRTEKQLSAIYQDLIGTVPLGRRLFGDLNPVHTGGPMQVSISFAEAHAEGYPYPLQGSIRDEVFSRRGGMYFGIAHLLGYRTRYPEIIYRFADFNAGWYASRNAAFQAALGELSGVTLALDGDLIRHGSDTPGATEGVALSLASRLDMSARTIHRDLEQGTRLEFEDTHLYQKVFAMADQKQGKPVPRAVLPGIDLHSPKITRKLTTAWFAKRVDTRWQTCMNQARAG